jgi:hypothetical protein
MGRYFQADRGHRGAVRCGTCLTSLGGDSINSAGTSDGAVAEISG